MYKRPLHHELFLELLRSALWNNVPDSNLFRNLDESVWLKLMSTAQKQALLGVCYPALSRLPSDCRPPQNIYLVWAAKANYIRQDNKKKLQVLSELLSLFEGNGIYPVIMKGFSSAVLYPEPDLRICGDIDLFIPDNYDDSLKLVSGLGYEMSETEKHHKFYYKGVLIELHHNIVNRPFCIHYSYNIIEQNYDGLRFRTFDNITTSILLLTHSVAHLIGPGLGFRHVCDWVMFNYNNKDSIDNKLLANSVNNNRLVRFVNIFNGLIINLKLIDERWIPYTEKKGSNVYKKEITSLEKDIFRQGDCGKEELFYRRNIKSLWVYYRVLIRFIRFFRYDIVMAVIMLRYRFIK